MFNYLKIICQHRIWWAGLGDDGEAERNWWHILENRLCEVPMYIRKQRGCGVYHFDFDVKAEGGVVYLYWGSKLIISNIIIKC